MCEDKSPVPAVSTEPAKAGNKAGLLKMVDLKFLVRHLRNLSGEDEITVDGAKVRVRSRNTFSVGAMHALRYIEEFYKELGVDSTRHRYTLTRGIPGFSKEHESFNLTVDFLGDVHPEKILIVGSHYDSQCGMPQMAEDNAPGCDDDLTGTVAGMMLAYILHELKNIGVKFDCTIRIAHFSGEEQWLKGSAAYVKTLLEPRAEIAGMLMLEMMGYTGDKTNQVDLHDDGDAKSHELAAVLMEAVKAYGLKLLPKDMHQHYKDRPSDHWSFLQEDFAAVCISDSSRKGINPRMHTTRDLLEAIDQAFYAEVVRMIVVGVAEIAKVDYEG